MNKEIVAYKATEAVLADLAARYKGIVFDVKTLKGMTEAKAAYKDVNSHSITLEQARVKEKAESLAYGRFVDSEAQRIALQLDALRLPIKEQIETETKRAEREAAAKIEAEKQRILAEQQAAKEAEERKMAEERAAIRKAQEEIERAARESRAKIEAQEREARLKIEEEQRQERLARQAREEVERQKRYAEEQALKKERDRLEAERRAVEEIKRKEREEAEAKAKAERDAAEAVEREKQRKANELLDGGAMLTLFKRKYGARAEFSGVVAAIDVYLGLAS